MAEVSDRDLALAMVRQAEEKRDEKIVEYGSQAYGPTEIAVRTDTPVTTVRRVLAKHGMGDFDLM